MEILYKAGDVHTAIKKIFSLPCDRRIAVVAYLGVNAENFLPNPKDMEIICCPEPGATSPEGIRKLLNRGARIQFSDGLHSKVYWSDKGCIITSANISHRALGSDAQKETGILIDSESFDIDRLIKESNPYDITQSLMDKLTKQDRKIKRAVGVKVGNTTKTEFIDWYNSSYKEPWKIGWWSDSELETSKAAVDKSKIEYNISNPVEFLNVAKNQVTKSDWLLTFETTNYGIKKIEWMYVDFVVAVDTDDKKAYEKEYPFQAIQAHKLSQYPPPPFHLSKQFTGAFKCAAKEYGIQKIENRTNLKASKKLLDLTKNYVKG